MNEWKSSIRSEVSTLLKQIRVQIKNVVLQYGWYNMVIYIYIFFFISVVIESCVRLWEYANAFTSFQPADRSSVTEKSTIFCRRSRYRDIHLV